MNANDIFTALSGIDEKYIDEAAYELHSDDRKSGSEKDGTVGKVVDITSKRRIGKFVKIVLPSVAAIILIVAVALPAVLRVTDNASSTAMSESAAPAADEAASEAPAEAEAPVAAAEEAMSGSTDDLESDSKQEEARNTLTAGKSPVVSEAEYSDGILVISLDMPLSESIKDMPYRLTVSDSDGDGSLVSEGILSELSDHIDIDDNRLIIDLTENEPAPGTYRLSFGDTFAQFEVK